MLCVQAEAWGTCPSILFICVFARWECSNETWPALAPPWCLRTRFSCLLIAAFNSIPVRVFYCCCLYTNHPTKKESHVQKCPWSSSPLVFHHSQASSPQGQSGVITLQKQTSVVQFPSFEVVFCPSSLWYTSMKSESISLLITTTARALQGCLQAALYNFRFVGSSLHLACVHSGIDATRAGVLVIRSTPQWDVVKDYT